MNFISTVQPATDAQLDHWTARIEEELEEFRNSEPFNRVRPQPSALRDDEQTGIIMMLIARCRRNEEGLS